MKKRIVYAGDSPAGGPANYLLSILESLPISYQHIPPAEKIKSETIEKCDVLILSDYGRDKLSARAENSISSLVNDRNGGLLMIGGWGSFTGLDAGWRNSNVEELLPVSCLSRDDRRNHSTGLLIQKKQEHPVLKGLPHDNLPVICGLNEILPKRSSEIVLEAQLLQNKGSKVRTGSKAYPLLVLSKEKRTAALATDLAPHWCGGWVDWGSKRVKLPVNKFISVEIGDAYIRFVSNLIFWLCGGK